MDNINTESNDFPEIQTIKNNKHKQQTFGDEARFKEIIDQDIEKMENLDNQNSFI